MFSRFARNHLYHSIRGGRKIDIAAKDDALLSKLVCDTDQVVPGSAALAVGVDEALLIADAHEAAGANGEAFLWLSAVYGRFRVVLHQIFYISDASGLCSRSCHCWPERLDSGK